MEHYKRIAVIKVLVLIMILFCTRVVIASSSENMAIFSKEELVYISQSKVLEVVSIDGIAPLSFVDSKGNVKGIGISLLDEISRISGFRFEYKLYDSVEDALNSDFDIYLNAARTYAPDSMKLSQPYLESETILYINSSVDAKDLKNKRYAAIKGGTLPDGVNEKNVIYFNDREEAINAVETGKADYGYGNEYSLAFYTIQNGYKKIITIPTSKEKREYCLGVSRDNELLLSILNKSLDAIDEGRMHVITLEVASLVERKITLPMIIGAYGEEIFALLFLILLILSLAIIFTARAKNQFKLEYKRHKILSRISNECLFEYQINTGLLDMSEMFVEKIAVIENKDKVISLLKEKILNGNEDNVDESTHTIELPLSDGEKGVFKIVLANLTEQSGKPYSIIGKLIDISDEAKEKERLITKTLLDGLTGLYNATAAGKFIAESIRNNGGNTKDALIIIDCDDFKRINDRYGHLEGNTALTNISAALKLTFRQTDIIGRIGGDEFCVYMHNIPSVDFIRLKCERLAELINELNGAFRVAVSIRIAVLEKESTFEVLFKQADDALYLAKNMGGSQIAVYNDHM